VAYTGTAASNVGGSTYHQIFRIVEKAGFVNEEISDTVLGELKDELKDLTYLFIDEISMVSCEHFYLISLRLVQIFALYKHAFGKVNVITAGDFAQLPPPLSRSLYSRYVGSSGKN
jgi:hypothetical protein